MHPLPPSFQAQNSQTQSSEGVTSPLATRNKADNVDSESSFKRVTNRILDKQRDTEEPVNDESSGQQTSQKVEEGAETHTGSDVLEGDSMVAREAQTDPIVEQLPENTDFQLNPTTVASDEYSDETETPVTEVDTSIARGLNKEFYRRSSSIGDNTPYSEKQTQEPQEGSLVVGIDGLIREEGQTNPTTTPPLAAGNTSASGFTQRNGSRSLTSEDKGILASKGLASQPTSQTITSSANATVDPDLAGPESVRFDSEKLLKANPSGKQLNTQGDTTVAKLITRNPTDVVTTTTLTDAALSEENTPSLTSSNGHVVTAKELSMHPQAVNNGRVQIPVNVNFGREEWSSMVAERTAMMAAQKISFAELQLDPPELGPLQVKVSVHQDQASVAFTVANSAVRDSLDQTVARLRELFSQQGLNLTNVDVSDQQQFSQQSQEEGAGLSRQSSDTTEQGDEAVLADSGETNHTLQMNYGIDSYA